MLDNGHSRPRPGRGAKVRPGEVALEAYRGVFGRLGLWLELAWLPLLLVLAGALIPGLVGGYLMPDPAASRESADIGLGDVANAVLAMLCLNAFAVRWHHAMLFPDPFQVPRGIFRRAWGRFLLYMLIFDATLVALASVVVLSGAASGTLTATGMLPDAFMLVVALAAAALAAAVALGMARCSLLLPAAAFGQPLGWGTAWRLMRGNTWRLVAASVLACLPVLLSVLLLLNGVLVAVHFDTAAALAQGKLPLGAFILRGLIGTLTDFLIVSLAASVLAGFYRRIVLRSDA